MLKKTCDICGREMEKPAVFGPPANVEIIPVGYTLRGFVPGEPMKEQDFCSRQCLVEFLKKHDFVEKDDAPF